MSWDFAYLIEDPITDIQLFPTNFMQLSKSIVYLESSLNGVKPNSDIDLRFFCPSFFHKIGFGLGYNFDLYQHTENDMSGFHGQFREFEHYFSFFTGIPFLKEGGFLALKLSYLYHHEDVAWVSKSNSDTLHIIDGDTTKSHFSHYGSATGEIKSPQWWISLDQLLPLQRTSSLDFLLEFCPYSYYQTRDDTVIDTGCDSTIVHIDPVKLIFSDQDSVMRNTHSSDKQIQPTGIITIIYKVNPSWGQLRLLGRFGLSKGYTDYQSDIISDHIHIYKTYTIYPDTSYVWCDSTVNHDTIYSIIHLDRITYNSVVGAGGNIPVKKNNVLLGIKLGYYYDRNNYNSRYDYCVQSYSALFSVGYEWFPISFLCLRDGIKMYLYRDIQKINDSGIEEIFKSTIFEGEGALGLGIIASNRLRFDYATDIDLDHLFKLWSLGCTYVF